MIIYIHIGYDAIASAFFLIIPLASLEVVIFYLYAKKEVNVGFFSTRYVSY